MRVCVINSIFSPHSRGGAEMVAEASARAFADGGHEVFVITCAPFEGWGSFAGKWEGMTRRTTNGEHEVSRNSAPPLTPPQGGGEANSISSPARGEARRGGSKVSVM